MFELWLLGKTLSPRSRTKDLGTLLSLVGVMIGVGSLVVAMAVVSGYESTLKRTIIDLVGHVLVMNRPQSAASEKETMDQIRPLVKDLQAYTPFVYLEAVLAKGGKLNGVIVEGIDPKSAPKVVRIHERVIAGHFDLAEKDGIRAALLGKGLVQKFQLKLGDVFSLVVPISQGTGGFRPKLMRFYLAGVVDLGRHDYDTRYVLTDLSSAQELGQIGKRVSGYRLRLARAEDAAQASFRISNELGFGYWAKDWQDANRNLFEAVKIEKVVIFFVLLVLIIAAAFNVSSTLFVNVVKRFHDISVMKTLGASEKRIRNVFILQGLALGGAGSLFGLGLGLLACYGFVWAQSRFGILPSEVYKLNHIEVEIRGMDLLLIIFATLIICLCATLPPARKGAKLKPVEGLRYE